jgi:hypothetical protein
MPLLETLGLALTGRAKAYDDLGFPESIPAIFRYDAPVVVDLPAPDQMRS